MKPKLFTLHLEASCDGQHARYRELLRATVERDEYQLRVRIDADTSYPNQSEAVVEHWDNGAWREAWRLLPLSVNNKDLTTYGGSSQRWLVRLGAFDPDRNKLVNLALAILANRDPA